MRGQAACVLSTEASVRETGPSQRVHVSKTDFKKECAAVSLSPFGFQDPAGRHKIWPRAKTKCLQMLHEFIGLGLWLTKQTSFNF